MITTWQEGVAACLEAYRPVGFFPGHEFADPQAVCRRLEQEFEITDRLAYGGHEAWYGPLMGLEPAACVEIGLKKAGAEHGAGYYQELIARIFEKISEPGSVETKEAHDNDGFVEVSVTARLRPGWSDTGRTQPIAAMQRFAPMHFWTDLLFLEQLLAGVLGASVTQLRSRIGRDEDHALLIFPPSVAADAVLEDFEAGLGLYDDDDPYGSLAFDAIAPNLPQPGPDTMAQILEETQLGALPEDEITHETYARISQILPDPEAPKTRGQKLLDWASWAAWAFAAFMVAKLALTMLTPDPLCYPFEEFLPDTGDCAVPCEAGEPQEACDARADALIKAHEAENGGGG